MNSKDTRPQKIAKKEAVQNANDFTYFQLQQNRGSDVAAPTAIQYDPASAAEDICDQTISRIPESHRRKSGGGKILQTDGLESKEGMLSIDKSGGVDFLSLTENHATYGSQPGKGSLLKGGVNGVLEHGTFVNTPDFELDNSKHYKGTNNRQLLQPQINERKSQTVVTSADGPYEYNTPANEEGI